MKFSLTKVLLVIIVIILSISIGYVSKFIDVHCDGTSQFYGGNNEELRATKMNISTSFDDLIWFLQVSNFGYYHNITVIILDTSYTLKLW